MEIEAPCLLYTVSHRKPPQIKVGKDLQPPDYVTQNLQPSPILISCQLRLIDPKPLVSNVSPNTPDLTSNLSKYVG